MRNNERRTGAPSPAPAGLNQQQGDSLSFVVPTEFVELPSRGQFYPEGHPLCGKDTIEIKFMTAKEEDILSSTTLLKKGLAISRLLQNLMVDKTIDADSLLSGDRDAIMIAARVSSYGPAYETNVFCSNCNASNNYVFDLKNAAMNEECFDNDMLQQKEIVFDSETKTFDLVLPQTGASVKLKLLSAADELKEEDLEKTKDNLITTTLLTFVSSIDGHTDKLTLKKFIESMPASDSRHIRKAYSKLVPKIGLSENFVCSACGDKKELEVPFKADFFWPR